MNLNRVELRERMEPTRLDRAISRTFPGWGLRREVARRRLAMETVRRELSYEAAQVTRLRASASRLQGPEDYSAFPDRLQLIRQMRDLEQNFGLFQSIMDKLAIYAFGRVNYQSSTGDDSVNGLYDAYLAECFARLDLSGRFNLRMLVCIAFKSMLRDGDFAFQWHATPDGLKLTGIEGDRLGGIYMTSGAEDYFQGVTVDLATGLPISYRVFFRTKANAFVNPVEIVPVDLIHLYDPRRFDAYRGVTPFAPVIDEARDLKEVLEACLIGTKFENYHAAIFYTDNALLPDDPSAYIQNSGNEVQASTGAPVVEQELKYGKVQAMPSTGKAEFIKSDRPAETFQTYLTTLIRLIGTALNLPYGFLYDLSALGGPSARMDAQQAMRTVEWHRQNMKERVLERVKNTLLIQGIAEGELPFVPKWSSGEWHFPPAVTIDVGRESAAGIKEWQAGLLTKQSWFAETGQDARDQERIIYAEAQRTVRNAQALAKEFGLPFETALNLIELKLPAGQRAPGTNGGPGGAAVDAAV